MLSRAARDMGHVSSHVQEARPRRALEKPTTRMKQEPSAAEDDLREQQGQISCQGVWICAQTANVAAGAAPPLPRYTDFSQRHWRLHFTLPRCCQSSHVVSWDSVSLDSE